MIDIAASAYDIVHTLAPYDGACVATNAPTDIASFSNVRKMAQNTLCGRRQSTTEESVCIHIAVFIMNTC